MPSNVHYSLFFLGLGLFLYGMNTFEKGLKSISGERFRKFLRNNVNNKYKSIASGAIATAFLQSSSLVSLLVLSFVGTNLINLTEGIGMVLGANLGTTITGWILTVFGFKLKIKEISYIIIGTCSLLLILNKKSKIVENYATAFLGFGLLFSGLDFMKSSIVNVAQSFDISSFAHLGTVSFLFIGLILTAIIQSSSASMAIILSGLSVQIIDFHQAAAMVIGSDLGTTTTVFFGTIGQGTNKKRVAFAHFFFNLVVDTIAFICLPLLIYLGQVIFSSSHELFQLVFLHSFFNFAGILLFIPILEIFSQKLIKSFPDKKVEMSYEFMPKESLLKLPVGEAIVILSKDYDFLRISIVELFYKSIALNNNDSSFFLENLGDHRFIHHYQSLKSLHGNIIQRVVSLEQLELNEKQSLIIKSLLSNCQHLLHALKSYKDIFEDLYIEYEDSQVISILTNLKNEFVNFLNGLSKDFCEGIQFNDEQIQKHESILKSQYETLHFQILKESNKQIISAKNITSILSLSREIYSVEKSYLKGLEES
ncbi:MAG: Na/Pi cotransporter family protein [Halobacteriovoraceae bacterium]|nr:Na/Pi cotransporter family protein [Halobacteriovoraceae bacterium]